MLTNQFVYNLPEELIADYPVAERTASRLLFLDPNSGVIKHTKFQDICAYLQSGDLLIMNDTKVMPARLFGYKETGGKVEVMLERLLNNSEALAQIRASKAPKINSKIIIAEKVIVEVIAQVKEFFKIKFLNIPDVPAILQQFGQVPLPPYIMRAEQALDLERYQTVYAKYLGSVAAPTAGLHFDTKLLTKINALGVNLGYITLHVGAGTFQPIRTDSIEQHTMHQEIMSVSSKLCETIAATKARGGRVIAVGTTTVRALETAALTNKLQAFTGETNIFIKPGFEFKVVDALITNFHLPKSSLLVLTCAFAGYEQVLQAYQAAISNRYRFYSYGDAMLLTKRVTS